MSQQQSPSKRGGGGGGQAGSAQGAGAGAGAGAGSKDIASAMISYQRKQSRAARANAATGAADSSSEPPLDPANSQSHSHPQSRSRSGRGRQRSGHSDRASAAGGSGTGGGSGSGPDREPSSSSLRIIQHGPASANSGHGSGRLQPQRLTQTELEALAEESPHHQPPHHHHHHHHNHHSHHHHHQQRQNQGSGSAGGGGKHSSNSVHRGPSSGGQNDTSSRKNGGSGGGGRHPSSPSLLHAPSGSMYSGTGGGNSSVFSTAAHAHNHNGIGTGSSTVTSVGTGTNNTDQTRTLFDPRRHDPVKFAMSKRLPGVLSLSQPHSAASSNASGHAHPAAHHHNLQHQAHHRLANGGLDSGVDSAAAGHLVGGPSPSATSSDASRERRRRRAPSSRSNATGGGGGGGALAGSEASRSDSNAGSELSGTGTGTSSRPGGESAAGAGGGTGGNAYLSDIATTYQVIARLETQLKEQHATAAAAGSSLGLLGPNGTSSTSGPAVISGGSDGGKSKGIVQRNGNGNGNANSNQGATQLTTLDISAAKAVDDGVDHAFWTSLATQHKHLAELNAAFMEMCWRPYIPSSFAGLPLKYNTPARLWQNAFHMFLERLRHALPFPSPSSPPPRGDRRGAARQAALLDHLEEFIYFAYAYYSNLHEAETFLRFRMAWIECLGDLARYRMAVAGFRMGLAAWEVGEKEGVVVGRGEATAVGDGPFGGQVLGRIDDDDAGSADEVSREQGRTAAAGAVHRVMEAPSIGEAALGDWDLEEKETWRETARGWYAKGLAEMPGTGRLHHHLGILSRGKEELKGLYHFAKSLTTSKPYPPARETMGPMCDREHQLRRVQPGASATDLFIHLHAMLFTRIDLDNFEDVFARYKEAIKTALAVGPGSAGATDGSQAGPGSAGRAFSRHGSLPISDGSELLGEGLMSEATWMIYGTVCIAGLLQYGATDALLSAPPVEHTTSDRKDAHRGSKGKITQKVKSQTPTAIMINKDSPSTSTAAAAAASAGQSPLRNGVALPNQQEHDGDAGDEVDGENELDGDEDGRLAEPHEDNIVSLQQPAFDPTSIPLTFSYAARVAFDTLEIVIQHGVLSRSGGGTSQNQSGGGGGQSSASSSSTTTTTDVPNPYITMLLTFLLTILKQAHTPVILERWVPWQALTELANSGPDAGNSTSLIPPGAALAEIPSKVTSGMPLPEDWCLRGMYWTTRRVFERGFWKAKGGAGLPAFESEIEVLDRLDGMGGAGAGADDERDSGENFVGTKKGAVPVGSQHGLAHASASGGGGDSESGHGTFAQLRWSRIGYAIGSLARTVPGLDARQSKKNGKSTLVIVAPLATKILEWKAEEEFLRAEENSRRVRTLFEDDDEDEVGEGWEEDSDSEASSDGENDESVSEAVRALKARRRALKQALKDAKKNPSALSRPRVNRSPSKRGQRKTAGGPTAAAAKPPGVSLDALPGYTILVLDTNIIVSPAGNLLRTLVEAKKWTVVLPLAVITELDGLSKNRNQVGDGAKAALKYIEQSLPTHGKWLKVQTSRGNYLYNLNIRFEHIDFAGLHLQNGDDVASSSAVDAQQRKTLQARNLDEIILRAAIWQEDHFVSRIPILFAQSASEREAASARVTPKTTKVVLITLDRNLRLKARARGIKAASDVELLDVVIGRDARPNG
ncbi:unnamed protein product [Tilletia laevis]|nr:unnamed protein product [Tilletia caries]CAD6959004.1 unnamed protein product [Tilletia laevis]CAD6966317.1 unnamed protein product [Tilletia laevis]CAD6984134.1 unnamed protein product [Tilletia controversa]CAD7065989.1 unnamed protein product [Tilletia caries]